MRRVWLLLALAVSAIAPATGAEIACPDTDVGRVAVVADGLLVVAPQMQGLQPDDLLLQLNSHVLHSCNDLTQAMAEARDRQLASLLLIRRQQVTHAFVLQPPLAAPPAVPLTAETLADSIAATATSQPALTPPPATFTPPSMTLTPAPLARSAVALVRDMLVHLRELGRSMQAKLPLPSAQPWAREVGDLRQAYEQHQVEQPALRLVEPILAYYQTIAEILVYKERTFRNAGNTRSQPDVVLPYNNGSQVSGWLQRYPFLQASVIAPPDTVLGFAEGSGRWSPDRAVALLVERALADGDALAQRLDATN
ncbi:MAG: hypothetical protein HYR72_10895 [Deltaproteobacteria bacterium]|nr:hypothetical protein [Deltaproteobacteria bacterium]MBI3388211.1 hypothetical protein [Deltaproteobacteria bacterium]